MGAHFHPDIVMDIEPMGPSLPDYDRKDYAPVHARFARQIERLKGAGADFFLCPDNTAHMALEAEGPPFALPGLHIQSIVAAEAKRRGFKKVGVTGTRWTMEGPVYPREFAVAGIASLAPDAQDRADVQSIIMDELVQGVFLETSRACFVDVVGRLAREGCDSVVLGCTELPMILNDETSPVPTLASTQLLAIAAVNVALGDAPMPTWRGGPRQ
jgi:aspartate racemase